jgi:hypothetical protein
LSLKVELPCGVKGLAGNCIEKWLCLL